MNSMEKTRVGLSPSLPAEHRVVVILGVIMTTDSGEEVSGPVFSPIYNLCRLPYIETFFLR